MKYIIIVFSFISLVIGQQVVIESAQIEVSEYDTNGRLISTSFVDIHDAQQTIIEEHQSEVEESNNETVEVFEYDSDGRVTSSRLVSRVVSTESLDEIQVISDVYDEKRIEYEYDVNGRVVN